jgi:serine/threonine protein kinase
MANFAKMEILERKNELGLILDLISSCLDLDAKKRPTINGLLNSPLFQLDSYEMTNAVRFSQNVILYRSPVSTVSMRITGPLRKVCYKAIKDPMGLFLIEEDILKLFAYTEDCIAHVSSLPIDQINDVLTENEKRKSLLNNNSTLNKKKDTSQLRVSPNSPLCAQIIEDKVFDMLIFICLRYTKYFNEYKQKRVKELEHLNSVHVRATQAARENANY